MAPSVTIIYGTESGNAELVSDELVDTLTNHGIHADALEMTDLDAFSLPDREILLVVCSTYEEGELPASAQPFHAALQEVRPDLGAVRFAAFGLGDSSYEHFGKGIDTMSEALVACGATKIGKTLKHDALSGDSLTEMAKSWAEEELTSLLSGTKEDRAVHPYVAEFHTRDDSAHEIVGGTTASAGTELNEELFDWNNKDFQRNPYPYYARARETAPVHYAGDRTYVVTRYDDVVKYFKLPIMSIRAPERYEHNPFESAFNETVLSLDPPEHARSRRLFSRWFTPKLIKQWVRYTDEALDAALSSYIPGTPIDGHVELGVNPTHITMSRVLDLPPGDAEPLFWALWDGMLIQATDPVPGTWDRSATAVDYMFSRTEALLRDKMANPGNGLADELIATHQRGEITWNEVLQNVVNFYMSGAPNPAYLIGSALEVFATRPDVMRDYRDNPEIRSKVVNEVARLNPVELLLTRFPTEDVEIGGVTIPAESCIKFPVGAVNRDPDVFDNPDDFDYNRPPEASHHLTFGLGTHSCAGQVIARAETETILARVAENYSAVKILEEPVRVITDRLVAYKSQPLALY